MVNKFKNKQRQWENYKLGKGVFRPKFVASGTRLIALGNSCLRQELVTGTCSVRPLLVLQAKPFLRQDIFLHVKHKLPLTCELSAKNEDLLQ